MMKKLRWLIKHQKEIEELLNTKEQMTKEPEKEQRYSLAGVPEYQLQYIDDILKDDKVK